VLLLAFHYSIESQLMHTVMHGAFLGLESAKQYTPANYETLAVPFRTRTWGEAHRIHHENPSLLHRDPDTVHSLLRVHASVPWRAWHLCNSFVGLLFTFECTAFDYDAFLKRQGLRPHDDHGDYVKFCYFVLYNYVLFTGCAVLWSPCHWQSVLLGTLLACNIRNVIFVALQTASSVGHRVSTLHCLRTAQSVSRSECADENVLFQVETSKNFVLRGFWQVLCGGLDRHIEHHLFPTLPPTRLHEVSPEVQRLCRLHGIQYTEYSSVWTSLWDSFSYLWTLSLPGAEVQVPKDI